MIHAGLQVTSYKIWRDDGGTEVDERRRAAGCRPYGCGGIVWGAEEEGRTHNGRPYGCGGENGDAEGDERRRAAEAPLRGADVELVGRRGHDPALRAEE